MRHPARIVPLAALLALLVAVAVAAPALAQKPPPPPPPVFVPPAAVSFDIRIVGRALSGPDEPNLRATGRINLGDDLAFELRLGDADDPTGDAFELVLVDGRLYTREGDAQWVYFDLDDLDGLFGGEDSPDPAGQAADECGDDLPDPALFADPEALLRQIGGRLSPPSFEQLRGVPVVHYSGELELARLLDFFGAALAMDPACADVVGDLMDDELDDVLGEFPPLQFDIYLGVNDMFPYRIALSLNLDDGQLDLTIDLTPSQTPFDIRPPAGARPALPPGR